MKKRKRNRTIRNGAHRRRRLRARVILVVTLVSRKNNKKVDASPTTSTTVAPADVHDGQSGGGRLPRGLRARPFPRPRRSRRISRRRRRMTIDANKTYVARLHDDRAATTHHPRRRRTRRRGVNNFVFLAKQGFYDGLKFHRVATDFVIQGGDPEGQRQRRPGLHTVDRASDKAGTRPGRSRWRTVRPNTTGSQFFLVLSDERRRRSRRTAIPLLRARQHHERRWTRRQDGSTRQSEPDRERPTTPTPTIPLYMFKVTITEK